MVAFVAVTGNRPKNYPKRLRILRKVNEYNPWTLISDVYDRKI